MMPTPDLNTIRAALSTITDPYTKEDVLTAGRIQGLTLKNGHVGFIIEAAPDAVAAFEPVRQAAESAVRAVPGVQQVTAVLTAHGAGPSAAHTPAQSADTVDRRQHALRRPGRARLSPEAQRRGAASPSPARSRLELPGVEHIIAVASGKGGVGKSTVAANLACAMARAGRRVGLVDADVYGPSVPMLMGLTGADPRIGEDKRLVPPEAHGVKVMSMGFMVDEDAAMIWRGPIVMSAITQMLNDTNWGDLDVLVVDLPPGTGDAQLTLVQRVALSGAVIVSTPQKIALADVRRGVEMFRSTEIPILGVIENMSAYTDPTAGIRLAPFGEGGARQAAVAMDAPYLGALPLDPMLTMASDKGEPPAAMAPDSPIGAAFTQLSEHILDALCASEDRQAPRIVFE